MQFAAEGDENRLLEAGEPDEQGPLAVPFDLPLDGAEEDDAGGGAGDGDGGVFVEERDLADVVPFLAAELGRDDVRLFGELRQPLVELVAGRGNVRLVGDGDHPGDFLQHGIVAAAVGPPVHSPGIFEKFLQFLRRTGQQERLAAGFLGGIRFQRSDLGNSFFCRLSSAATSKA